MKACDLCKECEALDLDDPNTDRVLFSFDKNSFVCQIRVIQRIVDTLPGDAQDICKDCAHEIIADACESYLLLRSFSEGTQALRTVTEYQNGTLPEAEFFVDDEAIQKQIEILNDMDCDDQCGCPCPVGDATVCMDQQKKERSALTFEKCLCECHGL